MSDTEDADSEESSGGKKSRFSVAMSSWRSAIVDGLLLLAILVSLTVGVREFFRDAYILEPIEVSDELKEDGYNSSVVAQELADQIEAIQRAAEEGAKHKALFRTSWTEAEIQVPGSKISLTTVVRYLKAEFGTENGRISGELTKRGEDFILTMRTSVDKYSPPSQTMVSATGHLDRLLKPAAMSILHMIKPCLLAPYWYGRETQSRK